jgi:hypothetical protein
MQVGTFRCILTRNGDGLLKSVAEILITCFSRLFMSEELRTKLHSFPTL